MDITLGPIGWLHAAACTYALLCGALVLGRAKGGDAHRLLGKHYLCAALLANISALFIHRLGGFNTFHWMAVASLGFLLVAFVFARWQRPRRYWLRLHLTAIIASYYMMAGGLVNEAFARLLILQGEFGWRTFAHSSVMILFLMMIAYFWGRTARLALLLLPAAVSAANLDVDVRGAAPAKGAVHVSLYDSKEKFLKSPARTMVVQPGEHARFDGLAPGRYALSLYQDENGNGSLDRKMLGIPAEPYGFGNDAKGSFGPPTFDAASVDLPVAGAQLVVNLKR
jgi:uncharacterized protein (DUF2141 family)/uncharacterized membrane protein